MMALLEHQDMPRSIGVPGINLWNLLVINNLVAWLALRESAGFSWDLPSQVKSRGLLFCAVMLVAFLRALIGNGPLAPLLGFDAFAAYFINCFKWFIPALILFDGCRSEQQTRRALLLVLSTYVLIALLTIKAMPLSGIGSGEELSAQAARRIRRDVGYHRVDVSMMLAGATWAIYCCAGLFTAAWQRMVILGLSGITLLGQALTGGRMGYIAFVGIGALLAFAKWRKLLLVGPVCLLGLCLLVPSVRERMLMGFGAMQGGIVTERSDDQITSGRVNIWPLTIERIKERPLFGWGRAGFQVAGLQQVSLAELGEEWPHPHNAYLEYLLDSGIMGMLLTIPIYATMVVWAFHLLRKPEAFLTAVGGAAFSLFMALLLASMGSQTLYTREGVVMMWAVAGLLARCWLEHDKVEHEEETDFFAADLQSVCLEELESAPQRVPNQIP
jgi:O-antigen ligase